MKIEVISTEYADNQRTDTVKHIYNKSDDYIQLGRLYVAFGQQTGKGEDTSQVQSLIAAQIEILKGYGDA